MNDEVDNKVKFPHLFLSLSPTGNTSNIRYESPMADSSF
jgi:hypothetical protein